MENPKEAIPKLHLRLPPIIACINHHLLPIFILSAAMFVPITMASALDMKNPFRE